jgi:hypothetical protein
MTKEINVELFRFDAKVDYLPYYKKYQIEYNDNDTILSLLNKISTIEKFDYEATNEFNLKINDLYLSAKEYICNIVELTSNEFKIEPISTFRATSDLLIDKTDYLEKILMFKEFVNPMDMDEYALNLELDYYASNTYDINRDYIGDHALLIAHDIIEQSPEHTKAILELISSKDDGIWYHTSLENRVFNYDITKEQRVQKLLSIMPQTRYSSINTDSKLDVSIPSISQYFKGFNIASYEGTSKDSCANIIKESFAHHVELSLKNEDLAPYSTLVSDDFSLKIAGNILLQAKDNNADFIVVRGKGDLALFDGQQRSIEKSIGREIDLPVVSQEQFLKVLGGEKDKSTLGFDKHKVKVSFL